MNYNIDSLSVRERNTPNRERSVNRQNAMVYLSISTPSFLFQSCFRARGDEKDKGFQYKENKAIVFADESNCSLRWYFPFLY